MSLPCPFCEIDERRAAWSSSEIVAVVDRFPVSPGHTLVVPRRHIETYFDATPAEHVALWSAVSEIKRLLDTSHRPDGYNVGFNAGPVAGQTVMHLHIHVIPRYRGDMDDPRGGVRGVIPAKQRYAPAEPSIDPLDPIDPCDDLLDFVPGEETHLLESLRRALRQADRADIVSAFVQPSGLALIAEDLQC